MMTSNPTFETITLADLEAMDAAGRDALPFGVVGMSPDTTVEIYNATEARLSGLDPQTVMGVPFFEGIGQCMNNFLVAQRFLDEADIDDVVPYVLTLRMRPTRARLRLLARAGGPRQFVLIER